MTSSEIGRVVIVGASLAGIRTALCLRDFGYAGAIVVVGQEEHLPYDRPPLSKRFLSGEWEHRDLVLVERETLREREVRWRPATRAVGGSPGRIALVTGEELLADAVVIATGARPRLLPGQPDHPRVHVLRSLDHAARLRAALAESRSLIIVGGGFIGAEVAATARTMGLSVTVVDSALLPLAHAVGSQPARLLAGLLSELGVRYRLGSALTTLTADDDGVRVGLGDGSCVHADQLLVGIGVEPDHAWLDDGPWLPPGSSGLACDGRGRVEGGPGLYAVGDVASWWSDRVGRRIRDEHWTSADHQARVVAAVIAGQDPPVAEPAYVWSDLGSAKVQVLGRPGTGRDCRLLLGDGSSVPSVFGYLASDELVGVTAVGAPRAIARLRPVLRSGGNVDAAREALGRSGAATNC